MYFSFFTDRTIKIGAALLGTCLACCHITQANVAERDAQFVEGLRQRRMFTLAESFCRRRLAEPDLTVVHRIQLITELSRCYATQAVHHTGPQRDEYWARAVAVIEDWNPQFEHNPHFLVARAQHALVNLARGEIARQELELQTPGTQDWELARQPLRKAIAELEALQLEATSHLQQSLSVNQTISKFELESFLANVQHQSSRAHHNRALTYSPDSADRLNDLNLSLEQLQRLVRVSADPRIGWKSQLDRMMVLRLLGQLDQAHEAAAALLAVNMNVAQRRQVQVELIRLALAEDNLPQALELVESMASVPRPPPADLAVLETWIAAWKQATENPERAEMWQARIANALRTLGDTHGDYWRRRGGALVAFAAQTGTHSNHLELMVQTAQDLYANHQWDDAVQAYLRAAEQAKTRRDLDRAFRLQLSAGRIEHDRKTYDAAIHLWRSFALDHRDHREAPEMHWLAVGAAAQTAAEATPAQPLTDATSPYLSLLTEHLAQWPEAATAIEAHWWLGQLRERQGEWAAAVEHYRAIPPEAHVANQALQALRRCWKRWWESPQPPGQPVDERIDEALRHCDRLVQDSHQRLPQRWSPLARTAAVVGAQIRL
ncbi:MAG: hypothetical protein MK179_07310, partial [Pirellulaceae bacterium]|nr:hypothetical protein [Pirellulaceae bacterium]